MKLLISDYIPVDIVVFLCTQICMILSLIKLKNEGQKDADICNLISLMYILSQWKI